MKKIGFIGMGNMARAIVRGVLAAGAADASDLSAYALHFDRLSAFAAETGIAPCRTLDELLERSDTVVVAVKPYVVEQVLQQAGDRLRGKALLSVAGRWSAIARCWTNPSAYRPSCPTRPAPWARACSSSRRPTRSPPRSTRRR